MAMHSRTRAGCGTCKDKHIKCDETRPLCSNCTTKGLSCPGYTQRLIWKTTVNRNGRPKAGKKRKALPRPSTPNGSDDNDEPADRGSEKTNQQSDHAAKLDEDTVDKASFSSSDRTAWNCDTFQSLPDASLEQDLEDFINATANLPIQSGEKTPTSQDAHSSNRSISRSNLEGTDGYDGGNATFGSYYAPSPSNLDLADFNVDMTGAEDILDDFSGVELSNVSAPDETCAQDLRARGHDRNSNETAPVVTGLYGPPWSALGTRPNYWIANSTPLHKGLIDPDTKHELTQYYFSTVCRILSVFDSHENPFRSDIPQVMLTCDYIHDCVIGMSAAHLANSRLGMESIALKHQARAMAGLSIVLRSMQAPSGTDNGQLVRQNPVAKSARYQALLAAMLLGISSAWYDATAASLEHLIGARTLFKAWLFDEEIFSDDGGPTLLTRHQSFLVGAMVYLECLASFILDQPVDSLRYLQRFSALAEGQRVYPNPWTGVSTPLFVHLAETAILMRYMRTHTRTVRPQAVVSSDTDEAIYQNASGLYERTLNHSAPTTGMTDDTKDPKTTPQQLISIDIIHRLVILMELIQAFPGLTKTGDNDPTSKTNTDNNSMVLDCAIAILTIVSHLPEDSGANQMLSIPLIIAGGALQVQELPMNKSNSSTAAHRGLRDSITTIMHGQDMLQKWREVTQTRLERTHRRIGVAPLRWANHLVQEVWRRADAARLQDGCTAWPAVHWMDIMIDQKLETLFG